MIKTDKVYAFTPFYGTNHKFNGFMDYFYVGNHINSVGLNDVYLKYNWSKKKFVINADLHYFASAGKIAEDTENNLGTELDLTFSYKNSGCCINQRRLVNPVCRRKYGTSERRRLWNRQSLGIHYAIGYTDFHKINRNLITVTGYFLYSLFVNNLLIKCKHILLFRHVINCSNTL
jgi:hypothetical protein